MSVELYCTETGQPSVSVAWSPFAPYHSITPDGVVTEGFSPVRFLDQVWGPDNEADRENELERAVDEAHAENERDLDAAMETARQEEHENVVKTVMDAIAGLVDVPEVTALIIGGVEGGLVGALIAEIEHRISKALG